METSPKYKHVKCEFCQYIGTSETEVGLTDFYYHVDQNDATGKIMHAEMIARYGDAEVDEYIDNDKNRTYGENHPITVARNLAAEKNLTLVYDWL